jgi:hypothetical protein
LLSAVRQPASTKSEDLLMEKLSEEKKVETTRILRAKKMYQRLKANGFHDTGKKIPIPEKKLTIPHSPKSILDKRLGVRKPVPLKKSVVKVASFGPKKSQGMVGQHHVTIPEPFQFSSGKRSTAATSSISSTTVVSHPPEKVLTGGEMFEQFNRETRTYKPVLQKAIDHQKTTTPHSPKLRTDQRAKLNNHKASSERILSHEEQEEKLAEEQRNFVFKARVLNRRIFESRGEYGVPKVTSKPLTVPLEMTLHTEKRASSPRVREREAAATAAAAAAAADFHSHDSERSRRNSSFAPASKSTFGSTGVVEKQIDVRRRMTQPVAFQFATTARGEKYRRAMEEQLEKERQLEKEKADLAIKAHPVPDFSRSSLPKRISVRESTIPEPFALQSVLLHEESMTHFQREIELERKREKQDTEVHAKEIPKSLYESPAVVAASKYLHNEILYSSQIFDVLTSTFFFSSFVFHYLYRRTKTNNDSNRHQIGK